MEKKDLVKFRLPEKRSSSFAERVGSLSKIKIIAIGLGAYFAVVLLFSLIELLIGVNGHFSKVSYVPDICDLIYFNFISILTIGYGDLSPVGVFRFFTILEAIAGLGIYSLFISIITIKLLIPKVNTIVFSKYAYYCAEERSFMIIYLNTAKRYMANVETSWYFKLGKDWQVTDVIKVPFITTSVQTFQFHFKDLETITSKLDEHDCLRVGITGSLGIGIFSTYVEYKINEILVIASRKPLTDYHGFSQVDQYIGTDEFKSHFNYCPNNALTLADYRPVKKESI